MLVTGVLHCSCIVPPISFQLYSNVIVVDDGSKETMGRMKDVMAAHLVPGWHWSKDMEDEDLLQTEHEDVAIRFNQYTIPREMMTANCVPILSTDHPATNGVVHVVADLLQPVTGSIRDLLVDHKLPSNKSNFELYPHCRPYLFLSVLSLLDLFMREVLSQSGQYTLFAPTDESFNQLDPVDQELLWSPDAIMQLSGEFSLYKCY
jgi:transforming growth factor-beta-induced protein